MTAIHRCEESLLMPIGNGGEVNTDATALPAGFAESARVRQQVKGATWALAAPVRVRDLGTNREEVYAAARAV